MAIVFISPREKQKLFILIIAVFFLIVVTIIGLTVFFAKPKGIQTEVVFHAPQIRINFDVLKSVRVQNLELPPGIEKQFTYQAKDKDSRSQTGKIAAISSAEAEVLLTGLGYQQIVLQEVLGGRENPFTPYYEIVVPPKTPVKKVIKK